MASGKLTDAPTHSWWPLQNQDVALLLSRKVADHYSARTNQTLEEREASPIIHLRKLNNWIKNCCTRYNGDIDHHQRRKKFTFPARLICGDYFELAMHYSWSTEAPARRALGQCIQHYFVQKASSLECCQMPMLSSKSLTKVHQLCSGVSSSIIKLA
ncbi:unnamed protein product, partial [Vitis vinifera]|uniref:mRNA cap 0 methyltransferase domain-containing protein n=1 Tax=Vitis vinifera TaxID=29760 RepID=D7SP40_VITVI